MKFVDLSLVSGEENIAADERLLASADRSPDNEILRLWQPDRHSVVLGISGRAQQEVRSDYCRANGIPVLRRSSGGAAVVIGPGCLNYSLILNTQSSGPLSNIRSTNAWIMQIHRDLCRRLSGKHIEICGHTDLAVDGRKFSGNSQRRLKNAILFHGTFLLEFDLSQIERCLKMPPREPEYRRRRTHLEFVTNLGINTAILGETLRRTWTTTAAPRGLNF